jgi:hypothetical protein
LAAHDAVVSHWHVTVARFSYDSKCDFGLVGDIGGRFVLGIDRDKPDFC